MRKIPANHDYLHSIKFDLAEHTNSKELKEQSPLKNNVSSNSKFLILFSKIKEIKSLVAKDSAIGKDDSKTEDCGHGLHSRGFSMKKVSK